MATPADDQPDTRDVMDGACHCGAVRFRVRLADGMGSARRCDCSYCGMRGAVVVSARADDLVVTAGADALSTYRFGTQVAAHHFCAHCGIYTHHRRRSNPSQYGVNVACLGISPFAFRELTVNDGRNHPSDTGRNTIAGTLRFEPTPDDTV